MKSIPFKTKKRKQQRSISANGRELVGRPHILLAVLQGPVGGEAQVLQCLQDRLGLLRAEHQLALSAALGRFRLGTVTGFAQLQVAGATSLKGNEGIPAKWKARLEMGERLFRNGRKVV